MKIAELARPGLIVFGIAATALLGFAAGMAVSRDPEAVRRTTRRVVRAAALGLERATLMAAQAREHVGDLWAEAREAAVADVDEADFERAAAAVSKPPRTAARATAKTTASSAASRAAETDADPAPAKKPQRRRATAADKRGAPGKTATPGDGNSARP